MKVFAVCRECGLSIQVCPSTPIEGQHRTVYRKHRMSNPKGYGPNPVCPGSRTDVPEAALKPEAPEP